MRQKGIIRGVLPASQTSNRPNSFWIENRAVVLVAIALLFYALVVGVGWRGGWIDATRAYLWMALPCIVPIVWYAIGFLKVADAEQDFGLLLSAGGWALIVFALLMKDSAVRAASGVQNSVAPADADSPAATVCLALALICLAGGAFLSWDAWRKENR
jgi:hypothetical protein